MLGMPVVFKLALNGYKVKIFTRSMDKAKLIFGDVVEIFVGNIGSASELVQAMEDCDAVHINLSGRAELTGGLNTAIAAKNSNIQLISYISGDTVKEENAWFPMIRNKLAVEKAIENTGKNFIIFRPTWFMESLPLYIKNNKAYHLGTQDLSFHFVAAEQYAMTVVKAYREPRAFNKKLYIHGPEKITFYQALKSYCQVFHPQAKISRLPLALAQFIAFVSYSHELSDGVKLMKYFYRVGEIGDPHETDEIFDLPKLTLGQWLEKRKKLSDPRFFEQIK